MLYENANKIVIQIATTNQESISPLSQMDLIELVKTRMKVKKVADAHPIVEAALSTYKFSEPTATVSVSVMFYLYLAPSIKPQTH